MYTLLKELSEEYGFSISRKSNAFSDISDAELNVAKLIIYSSTDGDVSSSIRDSVAKEKLKICDSTRGGLLLIHSACDFISTWPFLQDACIHQYFRHPPQERQQYTILKIEY